MARVAEGTPAIVLLASTYLAATRVRAAHSGVDELIPKPAAISEVLTRVWLCLRRRQLEQGAGQSALAMPVAEAPDLGLTLLDAVELMIAGGRTGRVAVASGGRRRGWVAVADGLVVDAQAGPLRGAPALGRLFRWRLTRAEQLTEPVRERVMSVTAPDLCSALFQVRAAWPRLIQPLPLEQVLAADFAAWTAAAPEVSSRLQSVLRLFDGRRRLIDVLDDAEIADPEACRFVSELLAKQLLVPCEPPAAGEQPLGRPQRRARGVLPGAPRGRRDARGLGPIRADPAARAAACRRVGAAPGRGCASSPAATPVPASATAPPRPADAAGPSPPSPRWPTREGWCSASWSRPLRASRAEAGTERHRDATRLGRPGGGRQPIWQHRVREAERCVGDAKWRYGPRCPRPLHPDRRPPGARHAGDDDDRGPAARPAAQRDPESRCTGRGCARFRTRRGVPGRAGQTRARPPTR